MGAFRIYHNATVHDLSPEEAKAMAVRTNKRILKRVIDDGASQEVIDAKRLDLEGIERVDLSKFEITPRDFTYKVTAMKGKDPKDYQFLEWDKPVGSPEENTLHKKLTASGVFEDIKDYDGLSDDEINRLSGQEVYEYIQEIDQYRNGITDVELPQRATQRLLEAGISGNKYPAGTISGGAKEGTYNYVMFDPKDITIDEVKLGGSPLHFIKP